jgi:hypothetical protein
LNNPNNLNNQNNLYYLNNTNLLNNVRNQNNINNTNILPYLNNNSSNLINTINNPTNNTINLQYNNNQILKNNSLLNNNTIISQNNNSINNTKENNLLRMQNINSLQNQNNYSLISFNNNQINNTNKNSGIQSNDFWQKIDSRKLSNSQNNIGSQNRNNNNRNNDSDQMNQVLDDFFGDFFNDEGLSHRVTSNNMQIRINEPSESLEPHIYFHSFFSPFGIMSGAFRDNYSSNFGDQMNRLMELIQRGRRGGQAHPPATNEALEKLKRFPLVERFCQKKEGKVELPNCCICQSEIELGKETVLLPCGHMYHWICCLEWLKTNNTCPICRFEIK